MKALQMLIVLLMIGQFSYGQEVIEKKYYKGKRAKPAANEEEATICDITIQEKDGTVRYERRNLSDDKVLKKWSFKNGMPVGKWILDYGEEIDYDFELVYADKEYEGIIRYDLETRKENQPVNEKFEPPVFPFEENNFQAYVARRVIYPAYCVENGIQGRIILQFVIDEAGKLTNLSVLKSADKNLDKEAARVIREAPGWIPAKTDGKPVSVTTTVHIIFSLQ